ncbi:branched-chain amino acid ABC transporter permease [Natronorubrum halophilum]|uniref:branched-chain amino acid ABC transporter permease n=1 Tax=Natronorubrum halophilum TaxID=1702106 RepID=UPI000EF6CF30
MSENSVQRWGQMFSGNRILVLLGFVAIVLLGNLGYSLLRGDLALSTVSSYFWSGILVGLIYGLAGVGLSMTYSILNFANFSHGDLMTAGAFGGWSATYVIAGLGVADFGSRILVRAGGGSQPAELGVSVLGTPFSIFVGLLVAVAFTILVALVIDRFVYKPMRSENGIALLIASIGVALVLRYLIQFVYGGRNRGVTESVQRWDVLPFLSDYGSINPHEFTLMVVAVGLMIGVHAVLQYSKLGKAMRAMADNQDLALVTGIPTERVVTWTWIIGAGLTGAAGFLVVLERGVIDFNLGWGLLLFVFAAVILGGIGSIYGAISGGLVIGLTSEMSRIWIPSDFTTAAAFVLMILVLVVKPSGLFGGVKTA